MRCKEYLVFEQVLHDGVEEHLVLDARVLADLGNVQNHQLLALAYLRRRETHAT